MRKEEERFLWDALGPVDFYDFRFDIFGEAFFKRLGYHRDLVSLIRRLGETLERRRFDDRLAEGDNRISNLNFYRKKNE